MRRNLERRRGTVAVLVAVCLIPVLGVVAIALDGGLLQHNRRAVQAAADAAALAAASDLYNNYGANSGVDVTGTAVAQGLAVAAHR